MSTQEIAEQQVSPGEAGDDISLSPQAISPLPNAWYIVRLEDVVEVKGGKRLPKGGGFAEEPTAYPYIRIVDFINSSVKIDGLKYLTAEVQQQISRYIIHKEDVYISIAGTIGIAGIIPNELDGANLTENAAKLVIRDRNALDKEYLANYLNGDEGQTQIENLTTKTTQPKLALTRIEQIRIPLPPIKEQQAIVQILKTVRDTIQTRRDELGLERERKAALMEYLFKHGTNGERQKQTEIGEIPESWQVARLEELAEIQSGGTPLRSHGEFYGGSFNWVKTLDLNEDILTYTEEKITELGLRSIRGKIRPVNTVMVAMYGGSGTIGKSGILGVPATTNQAVCCIEPNPSKFNSLYLLYYLVHIRPLWMQYAIGTRKDPNISKGIIQRKQIPLPPLDQQFEISKVFSSCDAKIGTLEQELLLLEELFYALLEELMTGRFSTLTLIAEGGTDE
jgi:type I restriction enzyme S subunit